MSLLIARPLAAVALALTGFAAHAEISHIASSSGYMLHKQGGSAVTRDWDGASAIQGFSGYGAIRVDGQCLTGTASGQQLRWEACRAGDKGQVWKLAGRKLNNELGWCADVQGGRGGAGVPVVAWSCSGAGNQQWKPLAKVSAQSLASQIRDAAARNTFIATAQSAAPGTVISLTTGRVVSAGGANVVSAGGANAIATGGGNVVSAGGMN